MDKRYFEDEKVLFERHPLPWKHQVLMIVDGNGRTVIHLGGTHDHGGHTIPGSKLCTLAGFIVEAANSRRQDIATTARSAAADILFPDGKPREGYSEEDVAEVAAIIVKHMGMYDYNLLQLLRAGADMVESAYVHVTHGGPSMEDAKGWVTRARSVT